MPASGRRRRFHEAADPHAPDGLEAVLDKVDELSSTIEAHITAGDWPSATALDERRRELLTAVFAGDAGMTLAPGAREVLTEILSRTERLIAGVREERRALAEQARHLSGATGALRAYESNY